ncbi:MAG: putative toxin-antitoxin system toxin component, PIN family [Pseudomonadota bacterium]|nr:putative toxin-antitoxin system toxin component, PIN family [Pseudomonadota bacterium]
MATLKVVLDTNVILSGLAYPGSIPGKIMQAWRTGSIEVFLSDYILDELRRVLPRLRHRHGLSDQEIDDLVDILSFQADIVMPLPVPDDLLRDSDDLPVLGTMLACQETFAVDYLITGDKDLLVLAEKFAVVSPAAFWARHGR